MKTLLIFPPSSDPAHPPLGIASLAGFLREKGEDVKLLDLNLLSYYYFLSSENLVLCKEKIIRRLEVLESTDKLPAEAAEEYRLLAQNSMAAPYLIDSIDESFSALRQPETYSSRARYKNAASIVKRAMEFVSAAYYPVRWYFRGFSMSYLPTKSLDVLKAVSDKKENLFIPFYHSYLPWIEALAPDIIGVSINYYCQLIPGLTLAALLKERLYNTRIVIGGGLICFFEGQWDVLKPFMETQNKMVDGFIPYEGEIPLFYLIDTLKNGKSIIEVPGLVYFDGANVCANPPSPPPNPLTLPPPDYDGLPLEKYISPEPVLLSLTSRGCYWGRCAFCSHAHLYRGEFRQRPPAQVFKEMEYLSQRFGATHFYFSDESVTPVTARQLARAIKQDNRPYQWFGEIRFEPSVDAGMLEELANGGCAMLMFGLESGQQRVLDLMHKGIRVETAAQILRRCKEVGIRAFVMFFAGFPTESPAEAEKTVEFIETHREYITQVAFTNFVLVKSSPVYAEPGKYGIMSIQPYEGEDLKIYAQYEVEKGLTAKEAVAFLEEVKGRPAILPLINTYLLSRSHLIFLSAEKEEEKSESGVSMALDLSRPWAFFPKIRDHVIPMALAFNLNKSFGEVRTGERFFQKEPLVAEGKKIEIDRNPTNYLFNPVMEKLVEVGEGGLLLVKPCTGRYSLEDILSNLGGQNQQTALDFYLKLNEAGFLDWEEGER